MPKAQNLKGRGRLARDNGQWSMVKAFRWCKIIKTPKNVQDNIWYIRCIIWSTATPEQFFTPKMSESLPRKARVLTSKER